MSLFYADEPICTPCSLFRYCSAKIQKLSTTEGGLYNDSLLNNSQTDIALMDNLDVNEIFS